MIEEDWWIQFIDFIREFKLPPHVEAKSVEAARIIRRTKGFVLVGDNLYKRSASGILMKCVILETARISLGKYMKESVEIMLHQGH